ncbi:hypothetical protein FRAAL1286 [Frankia alni ACN14a]|uniref:Uncharacterized protein n=1 Tax=Frankia alni (strain DSM 45986 / CECT 9034 / ACN14a) TaxID=326424 RepID=Q0RR75_FRAAA|nr:hypothetical protein FRAAL1286 [Frankia alni ACN14a]
MSVAAGDHSAFRSGASLVLILAHRNHAIRPADSRQPSSARATVLAMLDSDRAEGTTATSTATSLAGQDPENLPNTPSANLLSALRNRDHPCIMGGFPRHRQEPACRAGPTARRRRRPAPNVPAPPNSEPGFGYLRD